MERMRVPTLDGQPTARELAMRVLRETDATVNAGHVA